MVIVFSRTIHSSLHPLLMSAEQATAAYIHVDRWNWWLSPKNIFIHIFQNISTSINSRVSEHSMNFERYWAMWIFLGSKLIYSATTWAVRHITLGKTTICFNGWFIIWLVLLAWLAIKYWNRLCRRNQMEIYVVVCVVCKFDTCRQMINNFDNEIVQYWWNYFTGRSNPISRTTHYTELVHSSSVCVATADIYLLLWKQRGSWIKWRVDFVALHRIHRIEISHFSCASFSIMWVNCK